MISVPATPRRAARLLLALAIPALTAGCREAAVDAPAGASPEPRLQAARADAGPVATAVDVLLLDSIPWADMIGAGHRWRIAIRSSAGADTLDGLWASPRLAVAGDTLVHGFLVEADGSIPAGFAYDVRSRDVRRVGLPDDFLYFTAFALSPDGRHLAYAGRAEDGVGMAAVVRRWPEGTLVHRSGPVGGYPSDDRNSEVTWHAADSVTVLIRLEETDTPGGTWLRVSGAPGRTMGADSVVLPP